MFCTHEVRLHFFHMQSQRRPRTRSDKKFSSERKKSHIWYFVQEWIRQKKMLVKTLYKPRPPYITAKLYLEWILKRWNIVFKGVVLIASLKTQHRSDLCLRTSNPNDSLRFVQWSRIWRPWASKMSQIAVTMTCRICIRQSAILKIEWREEPQSFNAHVQPFLSPVDFNIKVVGDSHCIQKNKVMRWMRKLIFLPLATLLFIFNAVYGINALLCKLRFHNVCDLWLLCTLTGRNEMFLYFVNWMEK